MKPRSRRVGAMNQVMPERRLAFQQEPITALQTLQSVVAMAAKCFILCDLVSMKCTEEDLATRLSERSRTFVTELYLACGRLHESEVTLKRFLETCSPTWLRMHVTDMLLANYVDRLVPLERRHVNSKALSLEKIVSSYFFLLPAATTTSITEDTVVKAAAVKNTRRKGTPLQIIGNHEKHIRTNNLLTELNREHQLYNNKRTPKMSRKSKPLSTRESCEVYQRRNGRFLVEEQEPPKVASNPPFKKGYKNPSSFSNSKSHSTHLPPVNERQTRQSRSPSKLVRVALPQKMKQTDVHCHRATQRQVSQCTNPQGQQRKPQQAKRVTTKQSVARPNHVEEKTERSGGRIALKDGSMIHRQCLAPHALADPGTRRRKTTVKSGTSGRHLKQLTVSKQNEPRDNKPSTEKHQNATNQQQKARDDQMKPRSRRVGAMNQVMPERRLAFQQDTSELPQCTDRRIGLCIQTDPAQQHLTFIRVLRKRF
ncbi:hypothetical protein ACROYT_G010986 [Oculina patagonica]